MLSDVFELSQCCLARINLLYDVVMVNIPQNSYLLVGALSAQFLVNGKLFFNFVKHIFKSSHG